MSLRGKSDGESLTGTVTLVKETDLCGGGAEVGARYEVRYDPAKVASDEVRPLAFRMLKRSMPDENTMCWRPENDL